MRSKKILAAVCAAAVFAVSGCSDDEMTYSENTEILAAPSSETENASENRDKISPSEFGLSMKLDESGKLSISRNTPGSVPMGEEGSWTIFVYLCGTDLESDGGFATGDMSEMLEASTGSNVRFVVQTGGTYEWQNDVIGSDGICRYEISEGEMYLLDEQPAASMGDADTLSDFLKWGVENCPAAKMGLIFWDHGGGSISGVCFDQTCGDDSLFLTEINSALSEASSSMTDKFEFIGFDACLMGTVEAANILASYSRYMYGSEELEPGAGWDYTAIGDHLGEDPNADGAKLGKVVCDSFYEGCEEIDMGSAATFSVIDLSKIDDVVTSFNDYAKELYEVSEDISVLSAIKRNVKKADNYGGNNKSEGFTNMVDLAGIVNSGADYAEGADEVLAAIDNAVIYKRNGSAHSAACGMAAFYPLELQGNTELKIFGDVAISPYYLSFVDRTIYAGTTGGSTEDYDNSPILDFWSGWGSEDELDSYFDSCGDCEPTGESQFIEFYDEPQLLEDGTFGFSLTDESLEYTAGVQANVYMISDDEEDIIELGVSADIIPDWEYGIFTDNFDGYWFSLPDGQILAVYVVDECDGYDIYTSPVMINGEETNLRIIHDYVNGTVTIDGVWDGIDENGMAARTVYELCEGDSITPLYYAYPIDGDGEFFYYGSEYVFDGEPEIYFDLLFDGEYLYGFTIDDIFGDYLITDFVNFTIDGGDIYYSALS
ncbi:clostripain-related cysteine peptidase [Huintestinicola sp.]|uniref:clostripain-related cysteine peptidase n=1 Tax=Huintestinicola sp. TaxID=2981661 RepID=UPI003D7CBFA3